MRKLPLEFNEVINFVVDNVMELSTLGDKILELIDFNSGKFFTYLPDDANFEELYKFTEYGILPQNPVIEYITKNDKAYYTSVPNMKGWLAHFIFEKINSNESLCAVFEDYCASIEDPPESFQGINYLIRSFNEEVYYIVKKGETENTIKNCILKSNAIWHSLCILTVKSALNDDVNVLTLHEIQDLCRNAIFIIIGAYDNEGYLFWEKA